MDTADQAALLSLVTKAIERHGRIRMLIVLDAFEGWTTGEGWADNDLWLASDAPVVKAAIVGEARWQDEVFAFVSKPLRTFPIEYFEDEAAARLWLS
jgi:hypothetical protein